ncbi:MsnO8 family LLM class oxidoreductase [Brucella rhizosphaerae]|uniref:Luciferase oxidoreductase, group 1 family protein n=1 Tax=Brucella rhizosphaerae TaxID=571254 RepID=A0A256FP69_9HYPH|nr:MsnO8 family LLM class oxidoreductase [Brucella rhizosphaerae]OYR16643.1 luciferase oxidoreductase, group 1 family protein [Brucella rhizosphaerae]
MPYQISLLDKSPVAEGGTAEAALANTVSYAQAAEQAGYKRFWVAEHHHANELAGPSPEVLVSYLLASTKRIRIGSGGVMLQHYSPYKVAENFNLLAALGRGRVDLGVGKAPGGLPLSTKALQQEIDSAKRLDFNGKLAQLSAFLGGEKIGSGPFAGLAATPKPQTSAERFVLGASPESALLAAHSGWDFVYAGHLNGDTDNLQKTFDAYRDVTGKVPILALGAVVAENKEDVDAALLKIKIFKVHLASGTSVSVGTPEAAAEFARQAGEADYRVEEKRPSVLAGSPRQVKQKLDELHEQYGVAEFVLEFPAVSHEQRLVAVESLACERLAIAA